MQILAFEAKAMPCDLPCVSYMALYIISLHIIQSNSRTSTHHWRLNVEEGKVQAAVADSSLDSGLPGFGDVPDDPLLSLLTNKVALETGGWQLLADSSCKEDCNKKVNRFEESCVRSCRFRIQKYIDSKKMLHGY